MSNMTKPYKRNTRSDMAAIEAKLAAYIRKEFLPANNKADPENDENLFDAGIVDSAGLISFIVYLEKEFTITIPDEDLLPKNFASIASIAHYIRSRRQAHDECS